MFYLKIVKKNITSLSLLVGTTVVLYSSQVDGEERAGYFAQFVFLVSSDCCVALPRGAMGLSAVCDCSISWSGSLTLYMTFCWYLRVLPVLHRPEVVDIGVNTI